MLNSRFVIACVVGLLGAASLQAWPIRTNHLTFNGAVSLPGVTLAAGTYTFQAGPLDSNPDIVRVLTRDGRKVLYQGFTTSVSRSSGNGPSIVFDEAPADQPMPTRVWYPAGSARGHQFRY